MVTSPSAGMACALAVLLCATAADAQNFRPKNNISTEAAEAIADACLAWHREQPDRRPVAVWVIDADGISVVIKRADGAARVSVETARMKAETALYVAQPSSAAQNRLRTPDGQVNPAGIIQNTLLDVFPSAGGLPIIADEQVIGAVGVGGMMPDPARNYFPDEMCAQAGIDAVFKK